MISERIRLTPNVVFHELIKLPPSPRALLIERQCYFLSKQMKRQIFLPSGGLTKGDRLGTHERSWSLMWSRSFWNRLQGRVIPFAYAAARSARYKHGSIIELGLLACARLIHSRRCIDSIWYMHHIYIRIYIRISTHSILHKSWRNIRRAVMLDK